jgi:hypothetical protein
MHPRSIQNIDYGCALRNFSPTSVLTRLLAEVNWEHEICWMVKTQDDDTLRSSHGAGIGNLRESVYHLIVPHQGDKMDKLYIFSCRQVVGNIHMGRVAIIRSIS